MKELLRRRIIERMYTRGFYYETLAEKDARLKTRIIEKLLQYDSLPFDEICEIFFLQAP